jgi:serine/threonine-protein kinase
MILNTPAPVPSQTAPVSAAVDAVVLRCLEKSAANRFESVAAVEAAFRAATAGGAPSKDAKQVAQAVAISVAVPAAGVDEGDDDLLDDLTHVLDMAERSLEDAGLTNVLQTATNLLVARVLPDDPAAASEQVRATREQALALMRKIAARDGAHEGLQVAVRVHVATAVVSGEGSEREIDGPILDVGSWPADTIIEDEPNG